MSAVRQVAVAIVLVGAAISAALTLIFAVFVLLVMPAVNDQPDEPPADPMGDRRAACVDSGGSWHWENSWVGYVCEQEADR